MPQGGRKQGKIRRYPRSLHLNIGMIIFAIIAVYLIVSVWNYFHTKHIAGYEVREGSLTESSVYQGIALRDETVVGSAGAGYVNYFAAEGSRVGFGNLVYTIDETGGLLDLMQSEGATSVSFSDSDQRELRSQIVSFASSFDAENFHSAYDFRTSLEQTAQKITNTNVLSNIELLNETTRAQTIGYYSAPSSGIVVYSTDGMEDKSPSELTEEDFDESTYEKSLLLGNALVNEGDPVYKLIGNENWQIVIRPDEEQLKRLEEAGFGYMKVKFLRNRYEAWGYAEPVQTASGETLVSLSFSNSMISFCTERHLRIQIDTDTETGLKVPLSALVEKTFFLVPDEYMTVGAEGASGVLLKRTLENGTETAEFVRCEIYNSADGKTYLNDSDVSGGDVLIKPDSTETFTVGETATLYGVYNINKGYADFRRVERLKENESYAIVRSGTRYGLNEYDYIVLDSSTVVDNELIYE